MPSSKLLQLKSYLARYKNGVVIGFSAGVDSTFLTAVSREIFGDRALAVTVVSELIPHREVEEAVKIARSLGVKHRVLPVTVLDDPKITGNTEERCYYCKKKIFQMLTELAENEGYDAVLDGSNSDDIKDIRPGRKALKELKVISPLEELGIGKKEIREAARNMGLQVWDKAASACLASRIPYGTALSPEILQRVEKAEEILKGLGLKQIRVRDHHPMARIEIDPEEWRKVIINKSYVTDQLKKLGYIYVCLDLEGYKTGSLNI